MSRAVAGLSAVEVHSGFRGLYVGLVIRCAMLVGLAGAVSLSVAAGSNADSLPGVALGSVALLVAERSAVLFGIWMVMVVIVVRTFRHQLPIEISGRGIRYAESDEVQATVMSTSETLRDLNAELDWIRGAILDLQEAEARRPNPTLD